MRLYSKQGYGFNAVDLGTFPPTMSDSKGYSTAFIVYIDGQQYQARCKGRYIPTSPIFVQILGRFYRIAGTGQKQQKGIVSKTSGCTEFFTQKPL